MKQMLKGELLPSGKVLVGSVEYAPIKVERKSKTAVIRIDGEWRKIALSVETAPRERSKKHRSHIERDAEEMRDARKYASLMEKGKYAEADDIWIKLAYGAQLHPIYKERPLPDWERRVLEKAGMLSPEVEE